MAKAIWFQTTRGHSFWSIWNLNLNGRYGRDHCSGVPNLFSFFTLKRMQGKEPLWNQALDSDSLLLSPRIYALAPTRPGLHQLRTSGFCLVHLINPDCRCEPSLGSQLQCAGAGVSMERALILEEAETLKTIFYFIHTCLQSMHFTGASPLIICPCAFLFVSRNVIKAIDYKISWPHIRPRPVGGDSAGLAKSDHGNSFLYFIGQC